MSDQKSLYTPLLPRLEETFVEETKTEVDATKDAAEEIPEETFVEETKNDVDGSLAATS